MKTKGEIENVIYNEDLTLDEWIELYIEMKNYEFSDFDKECVESSINEGLEEIKELKKLEIYKNKLEEIGVNTNYLCRLISRLEPLTEELIDKLDYEEAEYYLYDLDDVILMLRLKLRLEELNFSIEDREYFDKRINEEIESVYKVDELKKIRNKMKEYKMNTKFVDKAIYNLVNNVYEDSDIPLFNQLDNYIESMPLDVLEKARNNILKEDGDTRIVDKAISRKKKAQESDNISLFGIWGLTQLFKRKKKSQEETTDYEEYQYEEEELEEDDFHYDDLD